MPLILTCRSTHLEQGESKLSIGSGELSAPRNRVLAGPAVGFWAGLRGRRPGVDVHKCPCLCAAVYWTFVGHQNK
jgi:hypothetical protein